MAEVITPEQCKAARGLLSWKQSDLDSASGVSRKTIASFENRRGERAPYGRTVKDLQRAFEDAGLEFVDHNGSGEGVRFRDPPSKR